MVNDVPLKVRNLSVDDEGRSLASKYLSSVMSASGPSPKKIYLLHQVPLVLSF